MGWRIALILFSTIGLASGAHIWNLYSHLDHMFTQQEQFIPSRIYSDVTRIAPAQSRSQIDARLKALSYTPSIGVDSTLNFQLHSRDYPAYLLPEGYAGAAGPGDATAEAKNVILKFDGSDARSLLQSIHVGLDGAQELNELYLEPEQVATLARGAKEIRALVKFQQIPSPVWKAIIAIEDQHFLDHKGLDPRGILRAIWVDLKTLTFAQGGSTITLQLVKNLMARRTKNILRKANELLLALMLEAKYDKEQILERYLNEVYLGQVGFLEVHGVAEGAEHFFGKKLEDITVAEAALMAGMIRNPFIYSPYRNLDKAMSRQRLVLSKMVETGQIAEAEAAIARKESIHLASPQSSGSRAPFFTDFVKAELLRILKDKMTDEELAAAGFRVYTSLDMNLNQDAQHAVSQGIDDIEKRVGLLNGANGAKGAKSGTLEGALAAVDQNTGFIRALIGGRNYAHSNFNRILNMKRQVGSTFKPFVYLTAFNQGEDSQGVAYGPGHPAFDGPWKLIYDNGRQTWVPKNYEPSFMGWISYRTALAHSVNTVAAKLGVELGMENIIKTARALGIESELPRVPSLALGVAELSPLELLRAYETIANHGVQNEVKILRGITHDNGTDYQRFVYHPTRVLPAASADLLTDMLQNVFTEGTAKDAYKLGFERAAAGKTGTTSHHRDAWFAGYTPQLTAVVWVGSDQDTDKKKPGKLTGANSALPIWIAFMKSALASEAPAVFSVNPEVVGVKIDRHSGKAASSSCSDSQVGVEKYRTDHAPKITACDADWPKAPTETIK